MSPWPRRAALALAAAILAWMVLFQTVLTPGTRAPHAVFAALFVAWAAAATLLWRAPRVGGVFAALLGVASAFGAMQSHGRALAPENVALAALAVAAAAAGAWTALTDRVSREP